MRRNRLLRLIADLSLVQLAPDIIPLLHAHTSDERAGSARALGRLGIKSAHDLIVPLLQDPVHDVRKSAQTALRNLEDKGGRQQRATPSKTAEGLRSWVVETSDEASVPGDEGDWKARLRSIIEP
jgi:HEAT repeat protein